MISIAAGGSCHEITHQLRRGHGKAVMISVAAGSSCHKIMHLLRRGHGKAVMTNIATGSLSHEATYRLSIGYGELSSASCGACLDKNHTPPSHFTYDIQYWLVNR